MYPNCLKYSKFHAKSVSENRLLVICLRKKIVIDKIKSKKFKNFVLNLYFDADYLYVSPFRKI